MDSKKASLAINPVMVLAELPDLAVMTEIKRHI